MEFWGACRCGCLVTPVESSSTQDSWVVRLLTSCPLHPALSPPPPCQCLQMHEESLLVPGQRQLMYVHTEQLEQIIQDQGRAVLACLQNPAPGSSTPKLLSPARGSWAVAARVGGVQRLPGSKKALVRLLVTDRTAVQVWKEGSVWCATFCWCMGIWLCVWQHAGCFWAGWGVGVALLGAAGQLQVAAEERVGFLRS